MYKNWVISRSTERSWCTFLSFVTIIAIWIKKEIITLYEFSIFAVLIQKYLCFIRKFVSVMRRKQLSSATRSVYCRHNGKSTFFSIIDLECYQIISFIFVFLMDVLKRSEISDQTLIWQKYLSYHFQKIVWDVWKRISVKSKVWSVVSDT